MRPVHHEKMRLSDPGLLKSDVGFIGGAWCRAVSGETFEVSDPATELAFASCAAMDGRDARLAITAAASAFPSFSRIPSRTRAKRLLRWHSLIEHARADLAQLLTLETGKPLRESIAEIEYGLTFVWWMAGEAERIHGQTISSASHPAVRYVTIKQPIGPVFLALPWNFPVALLLRKLATALAAGCTCIVKPSPETPLTALAVADLATRAGFESGVINVVTASLTTTPEVAKVACESAEVAKISFTGSTRVGKLLMAQSASTLKKMTLELGGNGAWVVFDDADLDHAVASLMASKWRASGQACITANRIYLHRGIADRFCGLFIAAMAQQLHVGPGLDEQTTLGPLTTPQSVARAKRHVQDAVDRGATVLAGGGVPPDRPQGYFFEPTLLMDVPDDAQIMREETFSPIAACRSFDTEEEVFGLVNSVEHGLTNYIFTRDLDRAWRALEGFESGNIGINTANPTSAESPFGGIKASGFGKEAGIGVGIDEFLITKTGALTLISDR